MDNTAPLFSVCLIARNEALTLPRLLESLKEFRARGGEIVVLDTGSTDNTVEVAKNAGCVVEAVGSRFRKTISPQEAAAINDFFVVEGEQPVVKMNDLYFDFTEARNYAVSLAKNNFCAMPDADEIFTAFDIDKINEAIANGSQRLEYSFIFSHDADGKPLIQFTHSKFYNRDVFKWVGIVHEVLHGSGKSTWLPENICKLEHYQNPEQSRGQYLTGLAVDCFQNQANDRNSHYFAREMFFSGRYRSAIREFERHIKMEAWKPERAQSMVFIGDCYKALGDEAQALSWYFKAFALDETRREPLIKLAEFYYAKKDAARAAAFGEAALTVSYRGYYNDNMFHYRSYPHEILYWALFHVGQKERAKYHWEKALEFSPTNSRYLHDARYFVKLPKVSVVIPQLGREEKLKKLLETLPQTANYPDLEIIVERDSFENRRGVPKLVKDAVAKATGDAICFLTNDCEPDADWLIQGVLQLKKHNTPALVALNDGVWHGKTATHWLADKGLLQFLPEKQYFSTDFQHVGCDNLLTAQCKKLGVYSYAPLAKVNHRHDWSDDVSKVAWDSTAVDADRALLKQKLEVLGCLEEA